MKTMMVGRKTVLAVAVASAMSGWHSSALAADLAPVVDPTAEVIVGVDDNIITTTGSAITTTANAAKGQVIRNDGIIKGQDHAIHAQQNGKLSAIHNSGTLEAVNGAAILVEEGGSVSYMNNTGKIIGGWVDDGNGNREQIAVDIRGAASDHQDALRVGAAGKGGEVIGNIYMNNKAGQTNVSVKEVGGVLKESNSYITFYGTDSDKAIFDGQVIANIAQVNIDKNGHMLLKAQEETILFDLVDYGSDLANQNNGKFDINDNATLEIQLGNTLGANTPVLQVNGNVNFKKDSTVYITGDIETVIGEHTLIVADKIDGFTDETVQGSWLTDVEVVDDFIDQEGGSDTIKVDISFKDDEDIDEADLSTWAKAGGADQTEQNIIEAFGKYAKEGMIITEDSISFATRNQTELGNLLGLANAGNAARLSGELTPDRSGAAIHAGQRAQNRQMDAISNRMNSLRADLYHGVNASNSGLWIRVFGHDAKQNVDGRIDGYDVTGMGFSIGIDGELGENSTVGLAFSQGQQDIDTIIYDTNYEVDTYQFSAYGLWNQDNYFASATVNAGVNYYDNYRTIGADAGYTGITRASADYKGFHYGLRMSAGMDLAFNDLLIQPLVAGELNRVDIENYEETGSPARYAYDSQDASQFKLGAGVHMTTVFEVGSGILTPHLTTMAWYDLNADHSTISGHAVVDPTITGTVNSGDGSSETRFELAAGLEYTNDGGVSMGLGLQQDFEDDGHDTQVHLRMNYAF